MLDLSDGLASDARRLAEAGRVRLTLDADALPLAPGVAEVARALGRDPVELGATGGEDFELCACLPAGVDAPDFATRVGRVVAGDPGVEFSAGGAAREVRCYEHRLG